MTDATFLELLNLYLDHEIDVAGAAQLEAEIQRDPARRKIYRDYCQMQKACSLLAQDFREQAPAADPKIVAFPANGRTWQPVAYVCGLGAVAACAILVFVSHPQIDGTAAAPRTDELVSIPAPTAQGQLAQNKPALVPVNVRHDIGARPAVRAVFAGYATENGPDGQLAAATAFPWMNEVQLRRMSQADQMKFDARPAPFVEPRGLNGNRLMLAGAKVEMGAFQFQR